jgi:hypothetical protein
MRKIRLEPETLAVESFVPAAEGPAAGTVYGAWDAVGSGESDCPNCWSAEPCTDIPIETCTCGCGPETGAGEPQQLNAPR